MKQNEIYFAGGCFWGMEQLMQSIPGVIEGISGYANGIGADYANYQTVCGGKTGFRETVRVVYDPSKVALEKLLLAYFYVIDPTLANRQGNDIGCQYQTGVYWTDPDTGKRVTRIAALEKEGSPTFHVEIRPLKNFYPAEEYHQNYLANNPGGYCHIPREEMAVFRRFPFRPEEYILPAREILRRRLGQDGI